jgi:hypothetical protein
MARYRANSKKNKKLISKEEMKQLYMDSPHLAWRAFCQSQGIDVASNSDEYPSALWRAEKRQKIIQAERERLKDMVVENMSAWIADVKNTIQKYPQVADAALGLIAHKIKSLNEIAAKNRMHEVDAQTLSTLATAINTITQAKHRALMIDQFNVDLAAMMDSASQIPEDETKLEAPKQVEIVIKHTESNAGSIKQDTNHLERFTDYYDFNKKKADLSEGSLVEKHLLPDSVKDMIKKEDIEDQDELERLLKEAENL